MGILGSRQRMGIAALMLAASAFVSRLMGLARDKIISWQFGASGESDMYFAAFVVPDIINYLLAGSFISITIIPLLAKGFSQNEDEAWRFFSCVFLWMLLAATALTLAGEIWAEQLATLVAPGFSAAQCARLAFFMRLILPAQIFFLGGASFTALLLLRRQFAAPSLTPLIYNGLIIACGLILPFLNINASNAHFGMTGYCIGVTLGAFTGAFLLPVMVAARDGIKLKLVWTHPWIKKFLLIALPLMLGQTVIMLDEQFLRVFGSMLGEGQVSLLNYGRRISQVPVALMGQALAVASYPFLVKLLAENDTDKFNITLARAFQTALALIIPCALWMMASAPQILELIFEGGQFGARETAACAPLTQIMLFPTPFWIIYMVLVRGYYAHEDTLTPAITGTILTAAFIPIYYFFAVPAGAWAVAALSGASVMIYVVWLALIWTKRHGPDAFSGMADICWQALACSLPGAALCWCALTWLLAHFFLFSPILTVCIKLMASGIIFAICLLITLPLAGPPPLKNFITRQWQKIRERFH